MRKKIFSVLIALVLVVSFGLVTVPIQAASEADITQAIENGVAWLAADQETDGSWPAFWEDVATTGLAVLKLEHRAYELGYDSPFDPAYEYSNNVIAGLDYLFGSANLFTQSIGTQDHTGGASGSIDDPDSNTNGIGVYAHGHSYPFDVYDTGIVLSAIAASGIPDRVVNVSGSVVDGQKYIDVAQDMVDWLAWAQSDFDYAPNSAGEGGWSYGALDNDDQMGSFGPDNSNSGYAVLGLAYAGGFGCTIPPWVKTELNAYVADIQDPVDGDANDGGSWYAPGYYGIPVNILKTGNLIMEMAMVGDTPATSRVVDALDYLVAHWSDASGANTPPGWDGDPAQYQAMFCAMKGLEYMGIDTFNSIDWYADFSDAIVAQQTTTTGPNFGSWQSSSGRGNPTIITAWALLILEKTAPPPPCPEEPGTRTLGFYKNHPCVVELLLPQTVGERTFNTVEDAMEQLLWAEPKGDHNLILERALLVAKFNVEMFGIGGCDLLGIGESVNQIITQGEELLADPNATKDELSAKYELLDEINNYGTDVPLPEEIAEACPPGGGPPKTPPGQGKK